jgi:hypothetical protein
MTLKTIKFSSIKIDAGTQYREELDQEVVAEYAEKMRDGQIFPPMKTIFDGVNHILIDGFTRYFAMLPMNPKTVDVDYKPGTVEDAQVAAMGVNDDHGQRRSNATKIRVVKAALEHPLTKDKSDREIAKICNVSHPFVAGIRNPEVKERQRKNVEKLVPKNKEEVEIIPPDAKLTEPKVDPIPPSSREDSGPTAEELAHDEAVAKAHQEFIDNLIESDDKFAAVVAENKKLLAENVMLKNRMRGLTNERNEAVKQAKSAQNKIDKLNKASK